MCGQNQFGEVGKTLSKSAKLRLKLSESDLQYCIIASLLQENADRW